MTNGDRMRQMSDEELAAFWATRIDCRACPNRDQCEKDCDCVCSMYGWFMREEKDMNCLDKVPKIVAPMELCKKIPSGYFRRVLYIWANLENGAVVQNNDLQTIKANNLAFVEYYPAPTLQEIYEEMRKIDADIEFSSCIIFNKLTFAYPICAEEALQTWLKLYQLKVKFESEE